MRRLIALATVAVIAAVAVVVAAGSGSTSHGASTAPAGRYSSAATSSGGTVGVGRTPLGRILVDARGRTLYLFEADKPEMSACSGACASIWPPLTTKAAPHVGRGVTAAALGTINGPGGQRKVTYHGHPLYTYAGDTKPGDITGQGLNQFGAEWYVISPGGDKIDNG
jgi:predicted lipoprotein with Yx(FWY)xxD motif